MRRLPGWRLCLPVDDDYEIVTIGKKKKKNRKKKKQQDGDYDVVPISTNKSSKKQNKDIKELNETNILEEEKEPKKSKISVIKDDYELSDEEIDRILENI